jgi:hypothetical protein
MSSSNAQIELPYLNVELEVEHRDGGREVVKARNRVSSGGRNVVRDLLANIGYPPSIIALGTSERAVSDGDSALWGEVYSREVDTRILQESRLRVQTFVDFDQANGGGSQTIKEVGLFAGGAECLTGGRLDVDGSVLSSRGTLFARAVVSPITKDNTVRITITWVVSISSV